MKIGVSIPECLISATKAKSQIYLAFSILIQEKIKKPLAEEVLFGALAQKGGTAFVSVEDGELVVSTEVSEKELA